MAFNRLIVSLLWSVAVFYSMASPAAAATLNVVGGQLLGATNVIVDGNSYDVQFLDGTCIALYDGCDEASDFSFTAGSAAFASQALLDQVFIDGIDGSFDSDPELTNGCTDTVRCRVYTPWASATPNSLGVSSLNNEGALPDFNVSTGFDTSLDTSGVANLTFAVWTLVPEPGTGILMSLGLIALSVRERREV